MSSSYQKLIRIWYRQREKKNRDWDFYLRYIFNKTERPKENKIKKQNLGKATPQDWFSFFAEGN